MSLSNTQFRRPINSLQIGVILIEVGLLVNEEYTFTRLLNFHTITHLSHDYLFRELSEKVQKTQKCPGGNYSARAFCI